MCEIMRKQHIQSVTSVLLGTDRSHWRSSAKRAEDTLRGKRVALAKANQAGVFRDERRLTQGIHEVIELVNDRLAR